MKQHEVKRINWNCSVLLNQNLSDIKEWIFNINIFYIYNLPIKVSNVFILAILFDEVNKKVKMLNVKFRIVFTKYLISRIVSYNVSYPLDVFSLKYANALCRNKCSRAMNDAFQTKALINFPRYFHRSILLPCTPHQTAKEVHRTRKLWLCIA